MVNKVHLKYWLNLIKEKWLHSCFYLFLILILFLFLVVYRHGEQIGKVMLNMYSNYCNELLLLFFNCMDMDRDKFKILIEKYAMFDNLRVEKLPIYFHDVYDEKANDFNAPSKADPSNKDEYDKSAFWTNEEITSRREEARANQQSYQTKKIFNHYYKTNAAEQIVLGISVILLLISFVSGIWIGQHGK